MATHLKPRIRYRNLPQLFLKARDRLMSHFRPILNHFGLTDQQWRVLRALDEQAQLEPHEICTRCQILSSSMTGVLARMEESGLIERNRVSNDQRRVVVRLAPKGDQLVRQMAPMIDLQYHHIEQAFGQHVFNDLFKTLKAFTEAQTEPVPTVALPLIEPGVSEPGQSPSSSATGTVPPTI